MAKSLLASALSLLTLVLSCDAALYLVGGTGGWDISTNLVTWAANKTFNAGDVLWFQYSRYHNVNEVDKAGYNTCNVTNAILTGSRGNTTVTLTTPGENYYFISGKPLYCFGGMRLQVYVQKGKATAPQPAPSPQPTKVHTETPPLITKPNSTANNNVLPPITGGVNYGVRGPVLEAGLCIIGALLWLISAAM